MAQIAPCQNSADYALAMRAARDYMAWLAMDLSFQHTDREFAGFAQMYGPPRGLYLLARQGEALAGGVGLRPMGGDVCEMKRLWVYDEFKGLGLGKMLCRQLIDHAGALGYGRMRLDTVARLTAANRLYESLGFQDIPAYYHNPDPTARYMELALAAG